MIIKNEILKIGQSRDLFRIKITLLFALTEREPIIS